ncbi:MAG: RimK domain-containing protein ATP-grasp [Parcubacteria group bacterium Gr01-1014_33]|nr:MAG: RimK domain-containing protein ATP-grasp [Parcubacteria group bacterium Gr01-1014_33]
MILLITRKDDIHADLVVKNLVELKAKFFRLNTDYLSDYEISLSLNSGYIRHPVTKRSVNLSEVKSIWIRRRSLPEKIKDVKEEFRSFCEEEWLRFYQNIWSVLEDRFWISPPYAIDATRSKMKQLIIARDIGFLVPETIITNSIDEVIELQRKFSVCIYKPHDGGALSTGSDQMIYTNIIDTILEKSEELTESLKICPGIFQPYIEKDYELRINVVGNKVFAAKIDSQKSDKTRIDWRRYDFKNVPHSIYHLPPEEENKCISLLEKLGLQFGAIDMIVTSAKKYIFLEINANGQWAWIQLLTKQLISFEIARLLAIHA